MSKGLLIGIVTVLSLAGAAGASMATTAKVDFALKNDLNSLIYNGFGATPDSGMMALVGAGLLVLTIFAKRRMNKEN